MSTGADAKTLPVTPEYADNHERIFGQRQEQPKTDRRVFVMRCSACDGAAHAPDAKLYCCGRCKGWTMGSIDASVAPPLHEENAAINAPVMAGRFYENTVSPVDGSDIGSRTKHREHMKAHGLTVASDFDKPGGFWDKAKAERESYREGKRRGSYRETIERALHELRKP